MTGDREDRADGEEPDAAPPPPRRPGFSSGLPEREEVPAPRSVAMTAWLVRLSLVAFAVPTALAAQRYPEIRRSLRDRLMEEAPDYSSSDIGQAVTVGLAVVAVLGLLMVLAELRAVAALRRRQAGGRTALLVLTLVHVPVLLVVSAFRGGGQLDLVLSAVQLLLLLLACLLATRSAVKEWLVAKPPLVAPPLLMGTAKEYRRPDPED
ncbi:hypothetical protein [Aeromicrobium marinum]|uniref:hypothetical protein n=1 Tax=Aeromicrobium marinum TaxID=219314 RepID=UPI00058CD7FA|nr:hypothetical protein [Aeromicrobium marinum]